MKEVEYTTLVNGQVVRLDTIRRWSQQAVVGKTIRELAPSTEVRRKYKRITHLMNRRIRRREDRETWELNNTCQSCEEYHGKTVGGICKLC